jgi:carbon storage regulator
MLVIQRRPGESILIGEDVELQVIETSPSRVKLGIRAPRQIPVIRKEVVELRRQNMAASGTTDDASIVALASRLRNTFVA